MSANIEVAERLQELCAGVYECVSIQLAHGMSERDIEELVRSAFADRGVHEYWYDVGVMVLIGAQRFIDGANADYETKAPSPEHRLDSGSSIYIDMHPRDSLSAVWGDWNTMAVFDPRSDDDGQVAFLEEMRDIQRNGIMQLRPDMSGRDVAQHFVHAYESRGITPLLSPHNDVGHSLESGEKAMSNRRFLNDVNADAIADIVYTIEPGGCRRSSTGSMLVGRFEEAVVVPSSGSPRILGNHTSPPLAIQAAS